MFLGRLIVDHYDVRKLHLYLAILFFCTKNVKVCFSSGGPPDLWLREARILKCPHYKETLISRSILSVWTTLWTGACPEGLHAKRLRCFLHSYPLIVVMSSLRHIQLPICHCYWGPAKAELDFLKGLLYISHETETRSLLIESQSLWRWGGVWGDGGVWRGSLLGHRPITWGAFLCS